MPVDKNLTDPILNTFRNMAKDLTDKKASGPAYDNMMATLARMEQLADELGDIMSFNAEMVKQNLYNGFSNYYGEAYAALAKQAASGGTDDASLLAMTLKAYEDAIINLKDVPYSDTLIKPIQELVDAGKSGVSYPVFLRIAEERGLFKAMEGTVVVRDVILEEIEFAKKSFLPLHVKMHEEKLAAFDELAKRSSLGIPDSFEFGLVRQKIEWKHEPEIIRRKECIHRWEKMLDIVYDWIDSFCSFAPHDERWADLRGMKFTLRNIKRTQDCAPGFLKVREKIFGDYFQLKWDDIFTHETFITEQAAGRVNFKGPHLDKIKQGYPFCNPGGMPSKELIGLAESIYRK